MKQLTCLKTCGCVSLPTPPHRLFSLVRDPQPGGRGIPHSAGTVLRGPGVLCLRVADPVTWHSLHPRLVSFVSFEEFLAIHPWDIASALLSLRPSRDANRTHALAPSSLFQVCLPSPTREPLFPVCGRSNSVCSSSVSPATKST